MIRFPRTTTWPALMILPGVYTSALTKAMVFTGDSWRVARLTQP
jgi:hypothetical protein